MGYSVGLVARRTDRHPQGPGRAALEDELDAWAQLCREGPWVGLYQFVIAIDDQLYWFVNVFDPVNYDAFHELPQDQIVKDLPYDDRADRVLIGRLGSWSALQHQIAAARAEAGAPEFAAPPETDDLFAIGPHGATSTLHYFDGQVGEFPEDWSLAPNLAHRLGFDHAYNAALWPAPLDELRAARGGQDPDTEAWIAHMRFMMQMMSRHKLLFQMQYDTGGLPPPTDEPPRLAAPKLRLDPSGTKAL